MAATPAAAPARTHAGAASTSSALPTSCPSPALPSGALLSAPRWSLWLACGALAGLSVDCVLYPLDTIKTRMQSAQGLRAAGGFGKLFAGVASAAAGSAPTAALFFLTYESSKAALTPLFHAPSPSQRVLSSGDAAAPVNPLVHCMAASAGEVVACLVRVPTENVKQKVQAGHYRTSFECFKALMKPGGTAIDASAAAAAGALPTAAMPAQSTPLRNFYRGFGTTILREIPFAFIQFPLYEWGKHRLAAHLAAGRPGSESVPLSGWQCACLGSISGGIAAALTTPLDVCKTRLMLQDMHPSVAAGVGSAPRRPLGFVSTLGALYTEGGVARLFSGVVPRVMWISIGGFVFFGAYESAKKQLQKAVHFTD